MRVIIALVVALALSGLTLQAGENTYNVENQLGGASAPWNQSGVWVIGDRATQRVINVNAISYESANSLIGTMQYQDEESIGFKAYRIGEISTSWIVYNQRGGSSAPWNQAGVWTIGSKLNQPVVRLLISSANKGASLSGVMAYKGEGLISFRAQLQNSVTPVPTVLPVPTKAPNTYNVENQLGGASAPWNQGGVWVIGGRATQRVINVNATSYDSGDSLFGTMQYQGEEPIGFKAKRIVETSTSWIVYNQRGGSSAPWNQAGVWTIGFRYKQPVVKLQISSTNNGANLNGIMAYSGERDISFRAQLV